MSAAKSKAMVPAVLAAVAALVVAFFLIDSWAYWSRISDLPQFYAAARMLAGGQGELIYNLQEIGFVEGNLFPGSGSRIIPLYLAPVAIAWLLPLSLMPANWVPLIWILVLAIALGASLVLLKPVCNLSTRQTCWLAALTVVSGPAWESLRIGQLSPLLLLSLVLSMRFVQTNRLLTAALCLSLLGLKPQELVPLLVFLIGNKRYKLLLCVAVVLLLLTGVSWILLGKEGYEQYAAVLQWSVTHSEFMQPELCATVRGQLLRFGPQWAAEIMQWSLFLNSLCLIFIFYLGRKLVDDGRWLQRGVMVTMPLGLVSSLHCHDYDLLLLLPAAAAFISDDYVTSLSSRLKLLLLIGLGMFLLPFYTVIHFLWLLPGGTVNPLFVILLLASAGLPGLVLYNKQKEGVRVHG